MEIKIDDSDPLKVLGKIYLRNYLEKNYGVDIPIPSNLEDGSLESNFWKCFDLLLDAAFQQGISFSGDDIGSYNLWVSTLKKANNIRGKDERERFIA